jgi:3'-5' exoribonuclease
MPNQPAKHPDKGPWIGEMEEGDHFVGFYIAQDIELVPFRDPSRGYYLRFSLADRSGVLEARIWEDAQETSADLGSSAIVKVEGRLEAYKGRSQVRVLRLREAEEGEFAIADLLPSTGRDVAAMLSAIGSEISRMRDPHLRALCTSFFADSEFSARFASAPAAQRIHHAYQGGLLEHTFEVLRLSEPLIELYPQLNADLLAAGILLHDIGKLEELRWDLDISYTDHGRLLGHISTSADMISRAIQAIPDFPPDLETQLLHMILSHHGRYEWNSPRRPKTLEAIALHHLENLDSQVNRFYLMIHRARAQGATWTAYDPSLGRALYAGGGRDEQ